MTVYAFGGSEAVMDISSVADGLLSIDEDELEHEAMDEAAQQKVGHKTEADEVDSDEIWDDGSPFGKLDPNTVVSFE